LTRARKFAAGHNGLFNEKSLLAAARFSAADFVTGVTDGGIRIEAFLLSARPRCPDTGIGLAERRIVLQSRFERAIQRKKVCRARFCLCSAEARKFDRTHLCGFLMFVLRLHSRHFGLLCTSDRYHS